jgi:hypothetical protein
MCLDFAIPAAEELMKAHEVFAKKEVRAQDYWTATKRVESGLRESEVSEVADGVAEFLKSWHRNYYRFRPPRKATLSGELEKLIASQLGGLLAFRTRSIVELNNADRPAVLRLFGLFEEVLDPVGAAKALNLLAPNFFPLWDNSISFHYGVLNSGVGYFLFMAVTGQQVRSVAAALPDGYLPLKVLDEYNYCRYTARWIA